MTKYHDIYKFVCDRIKPSERSIQRYHDELGKYYEVLLQMTLKTAVKKGIITCAQYQEITGEEYPASGDVSAAEALKEIQEVLGE